MAQYNIPYNNWEDGDVAYAEQVLANFNAILSAINNGIGADNLAADSVTDVKIGIRTVNDATAATDTAQLTAHLSGLANRIKAITGEDNWKTAPVKSLKTMNTAVVAAVGDSAAAVTTANTANTKADTAVATANTADGKADTAISTANTALGQDITEPYTGALGAMKIATDVQTDYETQKPLILQAVEDAENAVSSVALKADVSYVDSVAAGFVLGTVPDDSIVEAKLSPAVRTKLNEVVPVQSVAGKTGAVVLTKTDVGLSSVNNYGIATQAEAQAGVSNLKYMTPIRTMDSIKEYTKVLYNGSYYYAKIGVNPEDTSEFGVILTPVS